MSAIEYGIEKGYIEKKETENEAEEVFIIYPRRIMFEATLNKIISEFDDFGYDVSFDKSDKVYVVTNKSLLRKEHEKAVDNKCKIDDLCEEIDEPYEDLLNHIKGSVLFIAQDTKIDVGEVAGIFCTKLYNDISKWIESGEYKKICKYTEQMYDEHKMLLKELDKVIRSMVNE